MTLDGKAISPEDLVKNDAITYCVSKDGQYIRGYVSRNVVSGTISTTRTEEYTAGDYQVVTLAGNEYVVSAYCTKEITSGFTSDFQITYDGRLLGTNSTTSTGGNYGYLIKFASGDDAFSSTFRIKVLDRQGKVSEYTSATKVNSNINGEEKQWSASDIINSRAFDDRQLVVFDVNSEGKLKSLYQAFDYTKYLDDPDTLDFGKYYDETGRYSNGLIGSSAIEDSTLIFKIPFVDRDRDEDYKVIKKSDLSNGSYNAQIYDIRKGVANVLVIQDKEPNKVSDTANTLVIDKFSTAWDEENQQKVLELDGWSNGEYVSLKIDDDVSQAESLTLQEEKDIKSLVRGDVIQYELGSNDYIYTYRVLFNYSLRAGTSKYFEVNQDRQSNYKISNDDLYTLFGQSIRVYDYFMVETTSLTDKKYYRAYPTREINLYIYDTEKNEIIIGEPFDIEPGNQVFIRTKNIDQTVDMLVIQ